MSYSQLKNLMESGLRRACPAPEYSDGLRTLVERMSAGDNLRTASGVFRALSSPIRLAMLKCLGARELCVCEVSFALRLTQPTTSHHLRILEHAGLIGARPKGKWTFYRVTDRYVLRVVDTVGRMARRSHAAPQPTRSGRRGATRSADAHVR